MANELSLSAALQINKSGLGISGSAAITVNQAETGNQSVIQSIGTVTEQLAFTDIDNIGYLFVKNLDTTNLVEIGLVTPVSAANAFVTLLPGEFCLVPTRQETIYAKATNSAVNCHVVAAEL